MTLEQIASLQISDCEATLLLRLELEEATPEQLEAELLLYKSELIADEEARLAEIVRISNLNSRFSALADKGLIQLKLGISNPAAHFRDAVLGSSAEIAELKMAEMEQAYSEAIAEMQSTAWIDTRKAEYVKLDEMLLEALAEQAEGRPEKMAEYLALRAQIKTANPKPVE